MIISLNTLDEVDFTVLTNRAQKAERRKVILPSEQRISDWISGGLVSEKEINDLKVKINMQNRALDWKATCGLTKLDTQTHSLAKFYDKGLIQDYEYKVVKMYLATSIIDIIAIISKLDNYKKTSLWELRKPLSELFSGTMRDDKEIQKIITELLLLDNPILTAYIDKALNRKSEETIVDSLFGESTIYQGLSIIEGIVLPITLSLNILVYAIIGKLFNNFRRGEKRFICVDKHSVYYYVRNDVVDKFVNHEFYVNNAKLDISFEVIESPCKSEVTA